MIKLENVSKYYVMKSGKKNFILNNVSIDIPKCNLAVLGPNGAGKSTFLRLVGGAEMPNSGTITCQGEVSWPLGLAAGFQGSLTGRENIKFVCKVNGLSNKETRQVIEQILLFSELEDHFDNPIKTFSSGMRARLAFGLSVAFDFDTFLIDELTSVGDAAFRQKATQQFENIKKRANLVFVSHGLPMLEKTCNSALLLKNGSATFYADIKDGIEAYKQHIIKTNPEAAKQFTAKKAAKKAAPAKKITPKKAEPSDATEIPNS